MTALVLNGVQQSMDEWVSFNIPSCTQPSYRQHVATHISIIKYNSDVANIGGWFKSYK